MRHPKCKGWVEDTPNGQDDGCDYETILDCGDCKYGGGRKNPEVKRNSKSKGLLK